MNLSKGNRIELNFICLESQAGPLIVPYRVERSPRIKRLSLQIDASQHVVLKMPKWQPEWRGLDFLRQHGHWICDSLSCQPRVLPLRSYLLRHPRLSLWGRWVPVEMQLARARPAYELLSAPRAVRLWLDSRLPTGPQLVDLLRAIARQALPDRVEALRARVGVAVHGVSVRDQRGRWGSCSETGGISLNWRLVLLSPRLQDHVILHELAHLRHFNHSRNFYACLRELDPLAERHARELDEGAGSIIHLGRV